MIDMLQNPLKTFAKSRPTRMIAIWVASLALSQPMGFREASAAEDGPVKEEVQVEQQGYCISRSRGQRRSNEISRSRVCFVQPSLFATGRGLTHAAPVWMLRGDLERRNGLGAPLLL